MIGIQRVIARQRVAGGGPPGGTILVGDDTSRSDSLTGGGSANELIFELFTATASGDLATGSWRGQYATANNHRLAVYYGDNGESSDGDLIASSSSAGFAQAGVPETLEFTFSTGSIVSGTEYAIGVIADGDFWCSNDGNNLTGIDTSGTYASPPTSIGSDPAVGGHNVGLMQIWVTN